MSRRGKIYVGILIFGILLLVVSELNKPKKVNWFPSYATHHKIPFGSYVFNEQLQKISKHTKTVSRPPYEVLKESEIKGTYLFYNSSVNFGEAELHDLLDWTANGNTLFISAISFEEKLLDTLKLDISSINIFNNFENKFKVKNVNPRLSDSYFEYDKANTLYHFSSIDTINTKVISVIEKLNTEADSTKKTMISAIKQPFGEGHIILNTFPQAFTNYFILKSPNQNYTADLVSYINTNENIYVDQHYKNGKTFYTSPMYLFLNTKELKWAYYLFLIGVVIYVIFEAKRKQRAIPIVAPLKNQTMDFTRTIANMYYESSKHKDIAGHKIQHFLDYIRSNLHLSTSEISKEFIKKLASRSNNSIEDTQKLFDYIKIISEKYTLTKEELERLNVLIETYKSQN